MFLNLSSGQIINLDQVLFIYSNNLADDDYLSADVYYKNDSNGHTGIVVEDNINSFIDFFSTKLPTNFVKINSNYIINIDNINQIDFDYSENEDSGELIDHSISVEFSYKFNHMFLEDNNKSTDSNYLYNNLLSIHFDTYEQGEEIINRLFKACETRR